ncbi:phosphate transporter PhoU [Thermococcus sp. JCM 11816]|uniref:phosphate transporter PhoU n=1 Tax=Thermococcus sp. (strain JCM 11816 / KS-1) TaxID=1295125 RepID=UPI000B2D3A54
MKRKALEKARNLLRAEGDGVINGMRTLTTEVQRNEYGRMEDLLWEVANISEELNDVLIEILLRYQPMASELRFVRSAFNANYDLYRMMRHLSRIEVLLNLHGSEEQRDLVIEAMEIFHPPWVTGGVEALVSKREIPVEELPFIEFEFNELWDSYVRTETPPTLWEP